ncbi:hypothetical protein TraAM80_03914 [Trypanosoma rangeli]|uniref:Uncharacterized protein n=1 Tax=Trypanosoma rangeli TaxID=5698 RepID=A0A3R7MQ73_TRYRA|nr:uncharacterized protein TraAM80_03914 [Trypanosoma rangeli]RNF06460.1 hypothetical protein TraAM80_03914 [Trypanosoma rangeli]|eukprot:RNF06460.1 hypothetical protein TraAM80_03914 [Trypanosoma rangeli]
MRRWQCHVVVDACAASSRAIAVTRELLGLEQLQDVPTSTSRRPTGMHRGPGKRQTSEKEAELYRFIKRWDLQMREGWDELEAFKGLPKPKRQFGNEAAEVIWPYALLLERVVKVHPFTKSIYVYYSQRQATPQGKAAVETAKRFAREFLIPITFHNSQVYVETEMLLEYNETPWVVVHSLDGGQRILPVHPSEGTPADVAVAQLLSDVVKACEGLAAAVANPKEVTRMLNERPLQNQYVRINYQWFGDTPDERCSHLVKWDFDPAEVEPIMRQRTRHVLNWLNYDGNLPNHNSVRINVFREKSRLRSPRTTSGPKTFFNSAGSRANARSSRFGGQTAVGK